MRHNTDSIVSRYVRYTHLDHAAGTLALALALLLGLIVAMGVLVLRSEAEVIALLEWLGRSGSLGPALFIAIYAAVVVLVLPSVLLTLGAGFLFGVVQGTLLVMVGETIGATVAFLIGRHFLGGQTARFLTHHPRLRAINSQGKRRGWRIVLLTRLAPFFPGKLANYVFGLSRYSLSGFVFGNVIGIVPITVVNVYTGSLAADIAAVGTRAIPDSAVEWAALGCGLAVTAAVLVLAARAATRTLSPTRHVDPPP